MPPSFPSQSLLNLFLFGSRKKKKGEGTLFNLWAGEGLQGKGLLALGRWRSIVEDVIFLRQRERERGRERKVSFASRGQKRESPTRVCASVQISFECRGQILWKAELDYSARLSLHLSRPLTRCIAPHTLPEEMHLLRADSAL